MPPHANTHFEWAPHTFGTAGRQAGRATTGQGSPLADRIERDYDWNRSGDVIVAATSGRLNRLERIVWEYSRQAVSGILDYLAAAETDGREQDRAGEAALMDIATAIEQLRAAATVQVTHGPHTILGGFGRSGCRALRRRFDEFDLFVPGAVRRKF